MDEDSVGWAEQHLFGIRLQHTEELSLLVHLWSSSQQALPGTGPSVKTPEYWVLKIASEEKEAEMCPVTQGAMPSDVT